MNTSEMLSTISKLRRERNVVVSERNDALQALTGWENKWKAAVEMAARAEVERDEARTERDSLQVMRKEVVAANKGAKINAQVSNSLAGKLNRAERERDEALAKIKELIYIAARAIDLADIDLENDKFGVVSELRHELEGIKEGAK
jgi:hypothetical protein